MANMTNKAEIIHVRTAISDAASQTSDTATSIRLSCYAANKSIVPSSVLQEDDYSCHTNDFVTYIQSLRHPENQGIINPSTGNFKTGCAKGTDGYDTTYLKGISDELKVYTPSGKYKQGTMQSYTCYAVSDSCTFNTSNQLTGITHNCGTCYIKANEGYYNGKDYFTIAGPTPRTKTDISINWDYDDTYVASKHRHLRICATPSEGYYATGNTQCVGMISCICTVLSGASEGVVASGTSYYCGTALPTDVCCYYYIGGAKNSTPPLDKYTGVIFPKGYYHASHIGLVNVNGVTTCSNTSIGYQGSYTVPKGYTTQSYTVSNSITAGTATVTPPTASVVGKVTVGAGYYASNVDKNYNTGTALAGDILKNKTAINSTGKLITGSIEPRTAADITLGCNTSNSCHLTVSPAIGYYSATTAVEKGLPFGNVTASSMLSGYCAYNSDGELVKGCLNVAYCYKNSKYITSSVGRCLISSGTQYLQTCSFVVIDLYVSTYEQGGTHHNETLSPNNLYCVSSCIFATGSQSWITGVAISVGGLFQSSSLYQKSLSTSCPGIARAEICVTSGGLYQLNDLTNVLW